MHLTVPWVPEDIYFLSILMVHGESTSVRRKVLRKKITPGHTSYESHFLAIFGIMYLIKPFWSWCACLFSLMLRAEIWSYVTLCLICNAWKKNWTKAYLERKVLLKIVTNCFPKKYTSSFKYINRTEVSWEVPTLYVFRSQQDKKNFPSATLVLLYQVKL